MSNSCVFETALDYIPGSAGSVNAILSVIIYPITTTLLLLLFILVRNSSVFLRKRSLSLLFVSYLGAWVTWFCTSLFYAIGPKSYPCVLLGLFSYLACPLLICPVIVKMLRYVNEVSASLLQQEISMTRSFQTNSLDSTYSLSGEATKKTFLSHMLVAFCGTRTKKHRLNSAKFSRSHYFAPFWLSFFILPYLFAFFIRLIQNPKWNQGCYGCDLEFEDTVFLISMFSISLLIGLVLPNRLSRRDALRITRECFVTFLSTGVIAILFLILYAIDPNEMSKNGQFSFRILANFSALVAIYVQTLHQIIIARVSNRSLLLSPNFNRKDIFEDVMRNKDTRDALRNYLSSELSVEQLVFLEEIERFRSDRSTQHAKYIFRTYIEERSRYEINISSELRHEILEHKNDDTFDPAFFDMVYEDVKNSLIRDGFARFLNKVKKDPPQQRKSLAVQVLRGGNI